MSSAVRPPATRPSAGRRVPVAAAAALDVLAVLVFVLIGRGSHGEARDLAGTASTAWPFLSGLGAGWVAAWAWREPASRRTGVVVWPATVAVGMGLRAVDRQGVAVSFVVVAAVALGILLLGWRGLAALALRRARR